MSYNTMRIPDRIPRFRWLAPLWIVCAVFWVTIEGDLQLTLLFGVLTTIVIVGTIARKFLAGRTLTLAVWLLTAVVMGALLGLGSGLLTLLLMAVKTGLHAHGPEFSAMEVSWVLQQIPLWVVAGLVAGLGVGLLLRFVFPPN
ncbi:MAG: hypothetical protein JSV68_20495 [Anaerolineaceae bacterium]|nr:MAG: hypothetical protein JSV68_20495 [Anaerolineaceae bacterium]